MTIFLLDFLYIEVTDLKIIYPPIKLLEDLTFFF